MTILKIFISTIIAINCLSIKAMEPMEPWERVNMTEDEFILISSVVEAESNRDPENIEGRTMIAVCILNRVRDSRFPNTITEVLCAPGQFSTVNRRTQTAVTSRTEISDQAVIEAYNWIEQGDAPEVLYFNCRSYFSGIEPYACIGNNYFSCDGGIR